MDLPSPSRRALTLVATATVGSLAAVPLLDRLTDDGRPDPARDPRAGRTGGATPAPRWRVRRAAYD